MEAGRHLTPTLRRGRRALADPACVLSLPGPPLAEWSPAEIAKAAAAVSDAGRAPGKDGIVLTGPALFAETTAVPRAGLADKLLNAIAASPVPVVAACGGLSCSGLGLELALACHYRVAGEATRFSMPAIGCGELPVHGGVERLTPLVGLPAAVDLIVFRRALSAAEAEAVGLTDATANEAVLIATAADFVRDGAARERSSGTDAKRWLHDMPAVRARLAAKLPGQAAPQTALHAIETGLRMPFLRALAETREIAARLRASDQAIALRRSARLDQLPQASATLARDLRWALLREAVHVVDDGATPAEVDRALFAFGFASPPFASADRDGFPGDFDLPWHRYSPMPDLLRGERRRWHRRGGEAELDLILRDSSMAQRLRRRTIDRGEIVARCLAALLAAGVQALEIGHEVDDIDACTLAAASFPRWRGGLLHHAAATDLAGPVAMLERMNSGRGTVPAPSAVLRKAALEGRFTPPSPAHTR